MEEGNKNQSNKKTIDLSHALDDVGSASQGDRQESRYGFSSKDSRLTRWVIRYSGGFIKDKHQVAYILMGFVVLAVMATLFLLVNSGTEITEKNIYNPETAEPDTGE